MRITFRTISLLIVGLLAASSPLLAHHGNASFDTSRTVTVQGTVIQYVWANPHVFLKVDAKDSNGEVQPWTIEAQNAVNQANDGWTNATFKPGDQVVIDVTPVKNGRTIGRFKGRIVINGKQFKP